MIDFSKLTNKPIRIQLEPRDIFMTLPSRSKQYEYPRDVQSEVWKQWFDLRDKKNSIIKMNTGSGKTVVGLIILKSCLNEGKGPAVYVVPDNYLVNQVCLEAKKLGIQITTDENDLNYISKKAILVINIQKLVNGRSVFGMRSTNNVNIGSILIDDVHACLATIENQHSIVIPYGDPIYKTILDMFADSMKSQSQNKFLDITVNLVPFENMLIPFWEWQAKWNDVYTLLHRHSEKDYIGFPFPLLKDNFKICNCVISARNIEITPKCIPIHKITSFSRAERRIFMSATLSDDSIFINTLNLEPTDLTIISPEKANDIGDRLILFPQVMNEKISDLEIKLKLKELSNYHNVIVIVPSFLRSDFWKDVSDLILSSTNIEEGVEQLKNGHVGLVVLVNKYDGVDLPDDACRILVIDGLPKMRSEYDVIEKNVYPRNNRLCNEQIQKIEQGMGRGVRSNSDYCVVVLLGREFAEILFGNDGYNYFSEATKQQFQLSQQLWGQLEKPSLDEIMELTEYSLTRNIDWITTSKDVLSSIKYAVKPNLNKTTVAIRKAFNFADQDMYPEAVDILTLEKNTVSDIELRGLLKQHIAEYTNFYNPVQAQQILSSANVDNRMLLKPLQGIQFDRIVNQTGVQAQSFIQYNIEKNILPNIYILKINSLLEKLNFRPETANPFEASLMELSFLLGIYSRRPEAETGRGPDNFWDIGDSNFLVIECKNGTITDTICKHDCNQLNGSKIWFENIYTGNTYTSYPIMIHNSNVFEYASSPHQSIKIMTPDLLDNLKENIRNFASNVTKPKIFNNSVEVNRLLSQFKLLGKQIVENYTKGFKIKNT